MSFHKLYHLFFSWKGEIGRSVYAFTGIILFLVKWNLDRLFSLFANEVRYPTPFFYLLPEISSETVRTDLILPCCGLALPFIYLGLVLTVKRLRSLGWPIYSSILFFVPFVNLLFFFLLSILPQNSPLEWNRKRRPRTKEWLDRVLPRGKVACAALARGLSATLGTLFVSLSLLTGGGQDYGWGFFFTEKKSRRIPTASKQSEQGIKGADQVPPNQNRKGPSQCFHKTILPVDDPTDDKKKSNVNVEKGNDSPRIFNQLASILEKVALRKSVVKDSRHNDGEKD